MFKEKGFQGLNYWTYLIRFTLSTKDITGLEIVEN